MQDDITMPPKVQLRWLMKWIRLLSEYDFAGVGPIIIVGSRGSYYRFHDWFWHIHQERAGNDNNGPYSSPY